MIKFMLLISVLAIANLYSSIQQGKLSPELLSKYLEPIYQELRGELAYQDTERTHRATCEYGYSFFKMEQGDFTYTYPPAFLQELGEHICRALGDEPEPFTNIILSYYDKGFHLAPHVDVGYHNRYGECQFYFGEKVYGIVIEADSKGSLYFVQWQKDLTPPLDLEPIYVLPEENGAIFCLKGQWRSIPYFHGVSLVANKRISITFRTVIRTDDKLDNAVD